MQIPHYIQKNHKKCCVESHVAELMGHFSSMFNGLARSFSMKKGRKNEKCGGREAAEAMAKMAKKNEMMLCSSGTVHVDGSNNFASVFSKRGQKGVNQDCCIVWEVCISLSSLSYSYGRNSFNCDNNT